MIDHTYTCNRLTFLIWREWNDRNWQVCEYAKNLSSSAFDKWFSCISKKHCSQCYLLSQYYENFTSIYINPSCAHHLIAYWKDVHTYGIWYGIRAWIFLGESMLFTKVLLEMHSLWIKAKRRLYCVVHSCSIIFTGSIYLLKP